jgi:hypothetical protein
MGYKFNPFTGNFDQTDSPNGVFESVEVNGDINLDDGGTYETTVQVVTPTANRTISFPDATGTVALVAGSSGQVTYNNAGAQAGLTSANIGSTGEINISLAGAASTPPVSFTGSWFTGGTSTTTKPQLLIEPSGATSTAWSTSGTGLGVNAASGFAGNLLDLQVNGTSTFLVKNDRNIFMPGGALINLDRDSSNGIMLGSYGGRHIRLGSATSILFSSGNPTGGIDVQIKRDQQNVLIITDGSTGTGYLKQAPVAVSALPAAATVGAGTRGFVSDSTVAASGNFGATVTGGGSNNVPVFSDGTNWLIG